jgi:hypothetical protein
MFTISWYYLYGVGGAFYALGTYLCLRSGALDLQNAGERRMFVITTACLTLFAVAHALLQFVLPHVG